MRRGAICAAAAFATAALLAGPAPALDQKPRWFADIGDVEAAAKWGIPETDAVGFMVRCAAGGQVVMAPALYAMEKPAAMPDINFTVDDASYVRPANLAFSEVDAAWQAQATINRSDELIDALRRGSELTYDFSPPLRDGDRFTLSLSGSAKAIDAILKAC